MAQILKDSGVPGAALMIAGTCIGGGMLVLPTFTGGAGFVPAVLSNLISWVYMALTGWMLAQACLWSDKPSVHIASLASDYFGWKGRFIVSLLFLFLYECLLVSYFSGSAPYFQRLLSRVSATSGNDAAISFILMGLLTVLILWPGSRFFGWLNAALTTGLILTFAAMVTEGAPAIEPEYLNYRDWSEFLSPFPVLLGAFGYHNIVPPLVSSLNKNPAKVRQALWLGTLIPLITYLLWQAVVLGMIPADQLSVFPEESSIPVIEALARIRHTPTLRTIAFAFTFFAIVTSLLGVAFSMISFLADLFRKPDSSRFRLLFCVLTIIPPLTIAYSYPNLFVTIFSFAGGIGEATLNGIFPIVLFCLGLRHMKQAAKSYIPGGMKTILILSALTLLIMATECMRLLSGG
ncbi:MAG: hypothetical protein H6618_06050 [Deltaproteobacteria bacterium]|nr:hypothetical protein [Deltaproteobacteria bacterium]